MARSCSEFTVWSVRHPWYLFPLKFFLFPPSSTGTAVTSSNRCSFCFQYWLWTISELWQERRWIATNSCCKWRRTEMTLSFSCFVFFVVDWPLIFYLHLQNVVIIFCSFQTWNAAELSRTAKGRQRKMAANRPWFFKRIFVRLVHLVVSLRDNKFEYATRQCDGWGVAMVGAGWFKCFETLSGTMAWFRHERVSNFDFLSENQLLICWM